MNLLDKISNKQAKIGVIGLGYVGLPLVIEFCKKGFHVTGFDIDEKKTNNLAKGESYIKHIGSEKIQEVSDTFLPTTDFSHLSKMDCILICVPTPLSKNREPNMKYVFDTSEKIAAYLRKEQLIILESTTYPGTTDEDIKNILEKTELKAGKDFYLAYSPEREDPNNKEFSTGTIPKVVGGYSPSCSEVAVALYNHIIVKVVPVSSTRVAEATKLLENIYRSVNIAMINELKMLFDKMQIDIWEVIEAAKTKPFGFQPFYPGPGLGGHCIPIDPFYLTWKAREYDTSTRFIELAGEINTFMPYYVIERLTNALNDREQSIKNAKVLILGLAYKKDIDDTREAASFKLIELLNKKGAFVDYNDPFVPFTYKMRKYNYKMESVELTAENLQKYDCVLIATDHSDYDVEYISKNSKLIIDTRNLIKKADNVVKA